MRTYVVAAVALLAACGGGGTATGSGAQGAAGPVASSGDAALAFLRAAADSNLTRMAELWGTAAGPAARTKAPPDYDRRIVLMQIYLRNDSSRVMGQAAVPTDDSRRTVTVALWRSGCMKQVPLTMVRTGDGAWLVTDFDLSRLGNPARPCENAEPPGS